MSVPDACVVLPSAGSGERMRFHTPKQYISVLHKPLIYYTLINYVRFRWIKKMIVVVAPECIPLMSEIVNLLSVKDRNKVHVTAGGSSRHDSIYKGLKYIETLDDVDCDMVVIHDGVRPFCDEAILKEVIFSADVFGASGVTCPLTSTVVSVNNDGFLDESLNRSLYSASEMPQAFNMRIIMDAYRSCSAHDMKHGTECLHLVQKYMKVKAKMVAGNSLCWKVTYKKDLYTARGMVKEQEVVDVVGDKENIVLHNALKESLLSKFKKVEGPMIIPGQNIPNHVVIYPNANIADVIEQQEFQEIFGFNCQPVTIVNLTFNDNCKLDMQALQKRAKFVSKQSKNKNIISYYVVAQSEMTPEQRSETAEMITSLLFENNEKLNGIIFLM